MTEPDELFTLRNYFWLGNYQMAVTEGQILTTLPENYRVQRDVYIHRSYIGLGQYGFVLDAIKDNAPVDLQAVKLLATYASPSHDNDIVLMSLNEWLNDSSSANNPTLQLIAGIVFCREGRFKDALRALQSDTKLEMRAIKIQTLLRMDRIDLADKELKAMQQIDEDATITQLATSWVYLAQGGSKYKEAAYLLQELGDRFGMTATLLNGVAVANIHLKQYDAALKLLIDAAGKNPEDSDTIANLIVCCQHLQKPEEITQKYLTQLASMAPHHPLLEGYNTLGAAFDRVAAGYA